MTLYNHAVSPASSRPVPPASSRLVLYHTNYFSGAQNVSGSIKFRDNNLPVEICEIVSLLLAPSWERFLNGPLFERTSCAVAGFCGNGYRARRAWWRALVARASARRCTPCRRSTTDERLRSLAATSRRTAPTMVLIQPCFLLPIELIFITFVPLPICLKKFDHCAVWYCSATGKCNKNRVYVSLYRFCLK